MTPPAALPSVAAVDWKCRVLALLVVCAHTGAAALPCAPLLTASAPASAATHAGHDADGERSDHAHAGHGAHAHHAEAEPESSWTAPCPCGCGEAPAGAGPTARVGPGLLAATWQALPPAGDDRPPALESRTPVTPDPDREPVPI